MQVHARQSKIAWRKKIFHGTSFSMWIRQLCYKNDGRSAIPRQIKPMSPMASQGLLYPVAFKWPFRPPVPLGTGIQVAVCGVQ